LPFEFVRRFVVGLLANCPCESSDNNKRNSWYVPVLEQCSERRGVEIAIARSTQPGSKYAEEDVK
jgi:hypothetical protein